MNENIIIKQHYSPFVLAMLFMAWLIFAVAFLLPAIFMINSTKVDMTLSNQSALVLYIIGIIIIIVFILASIVAVIYVVADHNQCIELYNDKIIISGKEQTKMFYYKDIKGYYDNFFHNCTIVTKKYFHYKKGEISDKDKYFSFYLTAADHRRIFLILQDKTNIPNDLFNVIK